MRQLIIVLAFLLAGCSGAQAPQVAIPLVPTATPEPTCAELSAPFIASLQPTMREWADAVTLAGTTARISLSPQIEKLQGLRRSVEGLAPPECAKGVQTIFVQSMNQTIQGYLDFAAQNEMMAQIELESAATTLKVATAAMDNLVKGVEPGKPATRDEISKTYASLSFAERTLRDGQIVFTADSPDPSIEAFGPANAVTHLTILTTDKAELSRAAGAFVPEWTSYQEWIGLNANPTMGDNLINAGSRIVRMYRVGDSYLMTVYFL